MSQVNGKLSSRVMNMKFMKFSEPNGASSEEKSGSEGSKKLVVPDNSQWALKSLPCESEPKKNRRKVLSRKKKVNIRSGVSITEVKRESNEVVRGRRVMGEPPVNEQTKRPREDTEEDDYDLDKIFKQVKTPR